MMFTDISSILDTASFTHDEESMLMLRNLIEKDLKERCRFVDFLVDQSDSVVQKCLHFAGRFPKISDMNKTAVAKEFSDKAARIVSRARLAAYEVGEVFLMWKSISSLKTCADYIEKNAELLSLKLLAEKKSGDCDRAYMFVDEVQHTQTEE